MDDSYPGDDEFPKLTPQQLMSLKKHYLARDALYEKKITLEQAKAQGYKADLEEAWGMSELAP